MASPTPRDYLDRDFQVSAHCRQCRRMIVLDLRALIASGHGDVPLIELPLRCTACGSRGHGIIVQPVVRFPY
jgi:DNA-directed RNA polymerase subunit N (RpoN/RPB10)